MRNFIQRILNRVRPKKRYTVTLKYPVPLYDAYAHEHIRDTYTVIVVSRSLDGVRNTIAQAFPGNAIVEINEQ